MLSDTNAKSGRDLNIIISFWIKFFGPDFIKTVAAKRVEWWLKSTLPGSNINSSWANYAKSWVAYLIIWIAEAIVRQLFDHLIFKKWCKRWNVVCFVWNLTDKYNDPEAFSLVKCYLLKIRKITGIMLQSIMKVKLFRYFVLDKTMGFGRDICPSPSIRDFYHQKFC